MDLGNRTSVPYLTLFCETFCVMLAIFLAFVYLNAFPLNALSKCK